MSELACGPECIWPDEPHLEPRVEWLGDWPLMHGEDEERGDAPGHPTPYCLCGHPNYMTCPRWLSEGVLSMTIGNEETA